MAEKRSPGQRLNQKKSKQDTGKYLQAVEAWIGEADKFEENYEDIPVVGNLQNTTTNNTKLGSGKAGKGKKGKGFDEANDNINVDGMLMNIMDALKEEPQHKAETKKRVYSPLQRVKKVAPEPDGAKPVQNPDILNSSSNLRMEDADKSIKNQSPFSVDYEPKPFASAFLPSAKIANDTVHDNTVQLDQRVMQVNGTTLGDLSAIVPESIAKEHLDSRASLPNFLGSNPKLGLNQGYDQVLSPILSPVPFLQSPNKVQNNLTESQNPPSGRFIEKKGSGDSHNPLWSHMVTELETEPAVESNLSKQKAEINKKEEKKDRRAKAIDLLAMLAADEELGNVKEDDTKTKSKLGAHSKLKKRNTRVLTKKKIQKINEEYEADKALEEEQARAEESFSPSPTLGPSPGASPLAQREDWHFLLGNETPEPRFGQSRDGRLNVQPTQSLTGRPVDETRDTALFREGNRPGSGMSNIFITDGSGNAVGFHKEFAKTNILLDTIDSSPTHLLKKKNKPEKIEVYEEEGPLSVEFIKRGFDTEEDSFIFEHDDPKDLIEKPKRTKTMIDTDEFDIPISKGLINFFVGFTRRAAKLNYLVQEVRKPGYTLDTFFERNFTFFKGKLQITKNFFFLFVLLTGIMLYFIIDTLSASDLSRVQNDDRKDFLSKFFIPGAIIFTYYGIAFLYIPKKWLKLVMAAQLIPCVLIFLIDMGNTYVADHSFPYESVFICGYIIGLNVFWAITRAIRQDILTNYSWAMSMVFMTCWCILMPTAILAYSVYLSVTSRRFNYEWFKIYLILNAYIIRAHEMTIHIGIPTMFLLCFTWVYYHFRFFVGIKKIPEKKAANQQSAASVTKEAEERLKEQFEDDSDYEDYKKEEKKPSLKLRIYNSVQSLIKRLSDTVVVASSLSLGGSMIFVEGLILAYLYNTTLDKTDEELSGSVYLGVFLYFFIPITILFGVPIVATSKYHDKKMIIVPVVAILFPLFVTMPISYTMISDDDDDGSYILGLFLVLAPTAATVFWLTVSYFGLKKKKIKFSLLSFLFIFFVFPLLVLQPLISVDGFGDLKTARVFFAIFLAIGIIILVIIIAYLICRSLLIKEMIQQDRLNTDNYKLMGIFKTDLSPFGYWSNSLGFIVNFTISLFTLFHAPELVPGGEKGLTLGLAICFVIFYAYNIIVLQLQVIKPTEISNFGIKSLSAGIIESVRNNELYEEMQKIRDTTEKIKNYLRVFSAFLALLFLILALGLASDSFKSHLFSCLAIGTVVSHMIFEIHAAIKVKYANISQAVIPISFTYIWFTLALAFPAILQLTRVFFFDNEDRKKRMQLQLIVAAIVITVSVIAVIANIIFKGIELSQKIRYVLAYVRKQLEGIAVKSDYFVLQRVFEGWMENGERLLKKSLINRGKPAFWWPIPATNPNTKYSKVLLDFEAYKYMKLRLKAKLENEHADGINTKKKPYKKSFINNCLEFLGLCIPSLFNKKKIVPLDEELNEEIEELLDLEMYDVPLPPKDEDEESDEDEDEDAWDLGDWQIESKIAENKIEINEAVFKPLDDYVLRAMMYYDSGVKFAHNDAWTVDFLKFVFQLFAVGNYKFFKKRWMDYLGYKRFMILAAITPSAEFPDYIMDLVYATYTHNVGKGQIQRRIDYSNKKMEAKKKMKKNPKEEERDQKLKLKVFPVFEEDFEGFLVHIAKRRFPNEINDRDALYRLIRWHLFPNFLHLLPSLQKQYPHEYDYLRYLVDLILSRQKKSTFEQTIEINIRGSNSSSPIKVNENPNNSKDAFDPDREDEEIGGTNCLSAMCGCAYSLSANFFKFIFKNIGLILTNFFFLKTYEQKQADEEFDEMQQKADREEREQVQKIREDKAAETNLGDNPSLLEEGLNKQGIFRRKRKTYPHKPSPEWPVVAETMIRALKHAENDYETKKLSRKQPNFVLNIRNILTLLAKMIEIYSLASLAFRLEISWDWLYPIQNVVSFPSATTPAYTYKIWTSLGFSIFYWYVGIISIEFAKEGVLGADKATMKAGEFPSRGLAHSQILNYFSTALSVWIIRTFLDAFSCDYKQSIHTLFFVPSVECYSSDHYWLILIAGVGLILYYPVASFLYPNLQYLNLGNDIKHDTSSVVLFNQAKLIIIALHVFFPYSDEALIPLIISAAIWIALAIINNILKPNTISILNVWETSFYFMGAWAQISTIIMYFTKNSNLSTALLLIGLVIILLITMLVHRIHKSTQVSEPVAKTDTAPSKPVEKKEKKSGNKNKRKLETKESFSPLISHHRTELDLSGMKTLQNIENQTMIKPVDLTKSGILDISANI